MFGQHFSFWFRHLILIHCGLENSLTHISNIQHCGCGHLWFTSSKRWQCNNLLSIYFIAPTKYNSLTTRWQRHCRFSSAENIDVCLSLHAHTSSWGFLWRTSLCFLWLYCSPYYKFYPSPNCVWKLSLSLCLFRAALKVCSQLLHGYIHIPLSSVCAWVSNLYH